MSGTIRSRDDEAEQKAAREETDPSSAAKRNPQYEARVLAIEYLPLASLSRQDDLRTTRL